MTYNQLMYWQNVERRRSNLTDELINYLNYQNSAKARAESERHNKEAEAIDWGRIKISAGELAERERSNRENESIKWYSEREQARHNLQSEQVSWFNAFEGKRHNQASESIDWYKAAEQERHNREGEQIDWAKQRTTAEHYSKQDTVAGLRFNLDTAIAEYRKDIEYKDTAINKYNAETRRIETDIKSKQQDLAEARLGFDATVAQSKLLFDVADRLRDVGENVTSSAMDLFKGFFKLFTR